MAKPGAPSVRLALALDLAAGGLLDLGLVLATWAGTFALGRGGLAGGALDLLSFELVGDARGVCHRW